MVFCFFSPLFLWELWAPTYNWLLAVSLLGREIPWVGCAIPRLSRELAKLVVPEPYTEYRLAIQTEVWKVDDTEVHDHGGF